MSTVNLFQKFVLVLIKYFEFQATNILLFIANIFSFRFAASQQRGVIADKGD